MEPLNGGAAAFWDGIPLAERNCARLRAAQAEAAAPSPPDTSGGHPTRSPSDREVDLINKLDDDNLIDKALRAVFLRRRVTTA